MIGAYRISERHTCGLIKFCRSSNRYVSRAKDIRALVLRLKELASARPRYGYRRLHILLMREGWTVNHKRIHRLHKQLELQIRTKKRKKRA